MGFVSACRAAAATARVSKSELGPEWSFWHIDWALNMAFYGSLGLVAETCCNSGTAVGITEWHMANARADSQRNSVVLPDTRGESAAVVLIRIAKPSETERNDSTIDYRKHSVSAHCNATFCFRKTTKEKWTKVAADRWGGFRTTFLLCTIRPTPRLWILKSVQCRCSWML